MTTSSDMFALATILARGVSSGWKASPVFMQSKALEFVTGLPTTSESQVGDKVQIPYFYNVPKAKQLAEAAAITPVDGGSDNDEGSLVRIGAGLKINYHAILKGSRDENGKDPMENYQAKIQESLLLQLNDMVVTELANVPTAMLIDISSASNPKKLDSDALVRLFRKWGEEYDDKTVEGFVHPETKWDLYNMKDANGKPLYAASADGKLTHLAGMPITMSEAVPHTNTASAVASAGTSPPTITLTGTPTSNFDLKVVCTTAGALGTWKLKISIDGGQSYYAITTSAATVEIPDTGLTLNIASGSASTDNVWTASSSASIYQTIIAHPNSVIAWVGDVRVDIERKGDTDQTMTWFNQYVVVKRRRHPPGKRRSGSGVIKHN